MIKSNKNWRRNDKIKWGLIKLDKWVMQQQMKGSVARKFTLEKMMLSLFMYSSVLYFVLKRSGVLDRWCKGHCYSEPRCDDQCRIRVALYLDKAEMGGRKRKGKHQRL